MRRRRWRLLGSKGVTEYVFVRVVLNGSFPMPKHDSQQVNC